MQRHKANIAFASRRSYDRLAMLAALWGKTLGATVKKLVAQENERLGIRIKDKAWRDK